VTEAITLKSLSLAIGNTQILSDVSLSLAAGKITGLIGRSGSGKSMTALAIMGLAPSHATLSGEILLDGENILSLCEKALCKLRGNDIGMVFQEPMTALNPLQTIGDQVAETFLTHTKLSRSEARMKANEILNHVGLPAAEISPYRRPHELSGGQRQRVVIAIAVAMSPKVLIADEPTTALDVTTQAEILSLLKKLAAEDNIAILLITHDLAVLSHTADQIAVMKNGRVVSQDSVEAFYASGENAIAREFLPARVTRTAREYENSPPIINVSKIACDYVTSNNTFLKKPEIFRAVDEVSFSICKGENIGLVGESGCGKSTIAKALLGLHPITSGAITVDGKTFPTEDNAAMRRLRRKIQIVFQDPFSSFNPRCHIADIVTEPLHLLDTKPNKADAHDHALKLLESVGLDASSLTKYPHAFSGGQRQRIAIARALATEPELIVLDEATSALDIAARNQVLELLQSLSESRQVSFLFITHDLSVIRDIADRLMVMRTGKIVETGTTADVFNDPKDAYTKRLIEAAPQIQWRRQSSVDGEPHV
jgi:peptide/nickel transport system ATP-binding protein